MMRYKTWADAGIEIGRATGGEIQTTCPECSPKRKKKNARCLSANLDKQVWTCHHCGFSGKLNDYVECGVTPGAINKWKRHGIPHLRQIQIEKLTNGKLKADDLPATVKSAA